MGQGCNKLFCLYRRLLFYDVTTNFFYPSRLKQQRLFSSQINVAAAQ